MVSGAAERAGFGLDLERRQRAAHAPHLAVDPILPALFLGPQILVAHQDRRLHQPVGQRLLAQRGPARLARSRETVSARHAACRDIRRSPASHRAPCRRRWSATAL